MPAKNESEFIVQIGGPFNQLAVTEKSGGDGSREVSRYPDPLQDLDYITVGRRTYSNLTLRTPYDPNIHNDVLATIESYCGEAITVTVQAMTVCPESETDGSPIVYTGCVPVRWKPPDVKRGTGAGVSMLELEFAVNGMSIQGT
ncbi:MAG: hypothetical protein PUP93_31100 [Rhizonema sp. NSF051]|nr:hypothetical protein [Rhizonema sp. NSF051]